MTNAADIPYIGFPKIHRYNRQVIVTEKLDGTNALVFVNDEGTDVRAGSRTRWIDTKNDNFGFARWVEDNRDELLKLGPGSHFGEWWGKGIGRGYGLNEKCFSLFNVTRWTQSRPTCCGVVPILWIGLHEDLDPRKVLDCLEFRGSTAAPGFMRPEGIVIYHVPSEVLFKMTLDKNDERKGLIA